MKRALLSSISLIVIGATSALATDISATKSAPVLTPLPNWTGFYVGLNSGYNFGTNGNTQTSGYGPGDFVAKYNNVYSFSYPMTGVGLAQTGILGNIQSGFIGGGQVGYNYQLQQNFVIGLEADIQGAGITGSGGFTGAGINGANGSDGLYYSTNSAGQTSVSSSVNWLGTVRGRIGYLLTPTLLTYGTGGLAYGGVKASVASNVYTDFIGSHNPLYPFEGSQTFIGNSATSQTLVGYNVGAGFEWMFASNWSLKAESIYWNLGDINLSTTSVAGTGGAWNYNTSGQQRGLLPSQISNSTTSINYQGVIARAGINYHFNSGATPQIESAENLFLASKSVGSEEVSGSWTSFYSGLNSGYNFGTNNNISSTGYGPSELTANDGTNNFTYPMTGVGLAQTGNVSNTQSGFMGGGQVGYNYQTKDKFVIGLETDIQGGSIEGQAGLVGAGANGVTVNGTNYQASSSGQTSVSSSVNWLGTVRGRIGYLLTPTLLTYGTGGLAYGGVKASVASNVYTSYTQSNTTFPFEGSQTFVGNSSTSKTLVGYSLGGGAEWMFMPGWSIKGEALYWNLGNINLNTTSIAGAGGSWYYRLAGQQNGVLPNLISSSTNSINYQGILVRAGVNYHFNLEAAPVVAKL